MEQMKYCVYFQLSIYLFIFFAITMLVLVTLDACLHNQSATFFFA